MMPENSKLRTVFVFMDTSFMIVTKEEYLSLMALQLITAIDLTGFIYMKIDRGGDARTCRRVQFQAQQQATWIDALQTLCTRCTFSHVDALEVHFHGTPCRSCSSPCLYLPLAYFAAALRPTICETRLPQLW